MKIIIASLLFYFNLTIVHGQNQTKITGRLGIGTDAPRGQLEVSSPNLGAVVPRVASISNVTDGYGNPAVDGTIVYDTLRKAMMFRVKGVWLSISKSGNGQTILRPLSASPYSGDYTYVKASNTASTPSKDFFGFAVSISGDGNTLAVGAPQEDSNATGIDGNQNDNSAGDAGAVYVFVKTGESWSQQAYIKASNTGPGDSFGSRISLNADGNTLAVGASNEDSNSMGINGEQTNNGALNAGAVYILVRSGTVWSQQAYLKASNTQDNDFFGRSISLSSNGNTLAVSADREDSNATGINGDQTNNAAENSGAVYIFIRSGTVWTQQAYIKASNTEAVDAFGTPLSLSADGNHLVVGAPFEDSNATGINGNQSDNSATSSGAAYVFMRAGVVWSQQAYIKASNTNTDDWFSNNISMSGDGTTLVVGSLNEDSNGLGIGGNQNDNSSSNAGAVYVFVNTGMGWSQQSFIKASNAESTDNFGSGLSLSADGNTLAVSAVSEDGNSLGIDGNQTDNSAINSGAVYLFRRAGNIWFQEHYIKASNTGTTDFFGAVSLTADGNTLVVGANQEDSIATGINGNQSDNSATDSGAAYVIE